MDNILYIRKKTEGIMKYYLWVRWDVANKEAFEITKQGANFIEKETKDISTLLQDDGFVWVPTPTGKTLKIKLQKTLAYKIVTQETNPLEDATHYENSLN